MRLQPPAPARAVRRRPLAPLAAAVAALAAGVVGLVTFAGPPARADVERASIGTLQPLLDPVGRFADDEVDVIAAATVHMIAAATPPPPPPVSCPVPGAEFVDSWGAPRSGGRSHKGVDMMAPTGAPVLAPVAGTIRASNSALGGIGFYLVDDYGTTYFGSHLAQRFVESGRVEAGTQLGTVGSTGNAGTPHLHFEVMLVDHGSVNPYPFAANWCGLTDADPFAAY